MLYSKEIIEHFKHPKNIGKISKPSGVGKTGNLRCGDIMYLYLKIEKNKEGEEIIKDIKFETFGCTVAIANTSLLTTMVKGKTLEGAMKITKENLLKKLGKVPPFKIHCSLLAVEALTEAIYNYLKKKKREIPENLKITHQRIEKEKKIMEERHKDLIEIEEKIRL